MNILLSRPDILPRVPLDRLGRLTVGQYHRMIEVGVLRPGEPIELLEGLLVQKMTHNPPHDGSVTRINRALMRLLSDEWVVRVQCAITLKDSEPEPDFAIVRESDEDYDTRHPGPRDIALLIEVANSSLLEDRRYKGALYARARISEYWIVNVTERVVEVYSSPRSGKNARYRVQVDYRRNELVPLTLDGRGYGPVPANDLLPRTRQ